MAAHNVSPLMLVGYKSIGLYLGLSERQVSWAAKKGELPLFRFNGRPCARPETLQEWIAEREKAALAL